MAYVTGTANSLADLLTGLRTACTDNGWTLAGNVLNKGTCYASVVLGTSATYQHFADAALIVKAGNGIDGSNALTDAGDGSMHMGPINAGATFIDWDWPVTYHIHVLGAPDEVYMWVNYGAGQYWQHLGFGQSPSAGNAGSGNWCSATMGSSFAFNYSTASLVDISPSGCRFQGNTGGLIPCLPFFYGDFAGALSGSLVNSQIHGAISTADATIWSSSSGFLGWTGTSEGQVSAAQTMVPLLAYTPNAWNGETSLLPVQIIQGRPSAKVTLIGELQHSRYCRNDFIDPGSIISLGSDRWKIYPAFRKNVLARDGSGDLGIDHSGTMALAVRYDGP